MLQDKIKSVPYLPARDGLGLSREQVASLVALATVAPMLSLKFILLDYFRQLLVDFSQLGYLTHQCDPALRPRELPLEALDMHEEKCCDEFVVVD